MQTHPVLRAESLTCIRQQRKLFTGLSLQLQSGEGLMIEGVNGSGKSSLLRLLSGLSTPAAGDIFWQNQSIQNTRLEYGQQLHYIGHSNGIKLGLTVIENLALASRLSLETLSTSLDNVLALLKLQQDKHTLAKNLSAGQKRRIALAKLFILPKPLWILDEPLTALDTDTQQYFLDQLEIHLQQGGIAVISSHHHLPMKTIAMKTLRLTPC